MPENIPSNYLHSGAVTIGGERIMAAARVESAAKPANVVVKTVVVMSGTTSRRTEVG
jgi:hypothetical protein